MKIYKGMQYIVRWYALTYAMSWVCCIGHSNALMLALIWFVMRELIR